MPPAKFSHFVELSKLIPYALNSRTHNDSQIAQIAASIEKFGFTTPILHENYGIVAGHGRTLAVRKLFDAGKGIRFPDGKEVPRGKIPAINCVGWSETQKRAYVIADNKLALLAGWDDEILAAELSALKEADFDVSLTGFKDEAVNRLIDMKAGTGREITIKPTYEVIVEVENEAQQKAAYDLLKEKGFKCRLVTF